MLRFPRLFRSLLALTAVLALATGRLQSASAAQLDLVVVGGPDATVPPVIPGFPGGLTGVFGGDEFGLYKEVLTPVFVDVDGDGVPETLAGTTGTSTFTTAHGTITTSNMSFIVGTQTIGGEVFLEVESVGVVTAATGEFAGKTGGFTSRSLVHSTTFLFIADVDMTLSGS
jgi:hypothetical protein